MDCPSEEKLIRMKLDGIEGITHLDFDLGNRELIVFHEGRLDIIEGALEQLDLNSERMETESVGEVRFGDAEGQRQLLWVVLLINFAFFAIEMTTGLLSGSMGLVADSLDMLADAFVYGISLFAVGGTVTRKKNIATTAGYFQMTLAIAGIVEVLRRFIGVEATPDFSTMIWVSVLALVANGICLLLLQRSQSKDEAHMKASMIFTSNDVVINMGVITAGILVYLTGSKVPDLLIGAIVFVLVMRGALRILKLGK